MFKKFLCACTLVSVLMLTGTALFAASSDNSKNSCGCQSGCECSGDAKSCNCKK